MSPVGDPVPRRSVLKALTAKETKKAAKDLADAGWTFHEMGHKFYAYCPCETKSKIRIDGTPKNDSRHAQFIRSEAAKCPHKHDLMASGKRRLR